ncbi:methionine adenosyltransferase domain-containing protein [Lachnoclostridium sp. An138]|uniref:methionine adenosyltransferase domain-containing protein n=1 Tax=Lachnoclostridium sp. An138 TaxID=1965560 RepID=UPI000B39AA46|nr:hypothetical protein B5E82_12625 [Lachnoclostridium sp. An138]
MGVSWPLSINVNTFGTGRISDKILEKWIENNLDLYPAAIINRLQLRNPIYASTTNYGHFGNSCFSWEQIGDTLIKSLKQLLVKHMV